MANEELQLFSRWTPAECSSRLRTAIDVDERVLFTSFAGAFGKKPVIGKVSEESFQLRKRLWYHNGFQTHFYGAMRADRNGTVISGRFGTHPAHRISLIGAGVFFLLFECVGFLTLVRHLDEGSRGNYSNTMITMLAPIGMAGLMYLIVRFGRFLARDEARFLKAFLGQTLEAREKPDFRL